jgi:hypothetical protein
MARSNAPQLWQMKAKMSHIGTVVAGLVPAIHVFPSA